jgi:hypothetical protein
MNGRSMNGGLRLLLPVLAAVLAGCVVRAQPVPPVGKDGPVRIESRAMPFDNGDVTRETVGRLRYRGGVELRSRDPRFGGLSSLYVTPDGRAFTSITDKGHWIAGRLRYDSSGRLIGVADTRIGVLRAPNGLAIVGTPLHDAESVARVPGGFAIGFEGIHRVWLYPDAVPPFSARPRPLPQPPGIAAAPRNLGLEALAQLPDGRLVAIAEGLRAGPDTLLGWIADGAGRPWQTFRWTRTGRFAPSDATALPDGALLVLERRFSFIGGFAARLSIVPAAALRPGATVTGKELAILAPPFDVDNFEGVAARKGPHGETLIYLVSDDNFQPLEKTLLFMLELLPPAVAKD